MKKVLFIIETLHRGGAERALSNITTHFPKDWEIDILLNDASLIGYPYRGNILSLSKPNRKSAFYFVGVIIKRTIFLKRIKKNNGYTACISFLDSANISNVLSGNKHCRTILSIRTDAMREDTGLYNKLIFLPLSKRIFRYADKIVAVSREIESKLVDHLKIPENKIQTITNGYDYKWIKEKMEEDQQDSIIISKKIDIGKKLIVTAGRLTDEKGQWHLIRAFSKVLKEEPEARLLILGDGALKTYLSELIKNLNLDGKAVLAGYCNNPFWYLARATVFVLPSLYEGYPNALAEAVCCGTPCIAADVHSGAREILAPGLKATGERVTDVSEREYGILVPVCSGRKYKNQEPLETEEQKMADAILMLLHDSRLREHYRKESIKRGMELDINKKVHEWVDMILEKDIPECN